MKHCLEYITEFVVKTKLRQNQNKYEVYSYKDDLAYVVCETIDKFDELCKADNYQNVNAIKKRLNDEYFFTEDDILLMRPANGNGMIAIGYNMYNKNTFYNKEVNNNKYMKVGEITADKFTYNYFKQQGWTKK